MVPRNPNILILFLVLFAFSPVKSEVIWGPTLERNGGEYIFETGNRFPNLSGIRGGSRISFPRNSTMFGLFGAYSEGKWEIRGSVKSTIWTQNSGQARDEDFLLATTAQEQTTNIATREWTYHDSTNVFSGSRNFADGIGKSSITENRIETFGRYYFQNASPNYWTQGSGFFLTAGARYSYFKYVFYDVNQFIDSRPLFYAPIGLGLSYTNNLNEYFYGFGYRNSFENFYFDFSFMPSIGRITTRDFHVQRSINFLSDNIGVGFQMSNEVGYKFNDSWLTYIRLTHRRFFSEGKFRARGGLSYDDILSNFVGGFKSHINIKDFSIEIAALNKVEWSVPREESKEKEKPEKEETPIIPSNNE
ncbi:putative porin [Leptospira sp. 'Mane']|uniref:putative porin n=1 Tax=Leptospira sp. 'Mane' TaxID=3387407 RepID=UPI00398A6055